MAAPARPLAPIPRLENGDHLSRDEFERRYEAMPELKKAELIAGVVYVTSPVGPDHSEPHADLIGWLTAYRISHPGVLLGDNGSVRLGDADEVQPDAYLRRQDGTARRVGTFIEGAPEFVAEVAATSASYDLHTKMDAYRRAGVQEYLVWRVLDGVIDWFSLEGGRYVPVAPDASGVIRSRVFPGLRLRVAAMLARDVSAVVSEQLAAND